MRATLAQAGFITLPRTKGTLMCNAGDDTGKKNPCQHFAAANRLVSSKTVCSEIAVNYYKTSTFSGIYGVINGPQKLVILRGLTPPRILYRLSEHVSNRHCHHRPRNFCGPGGGGTGGSSDQ